MKKLRNHKKLTAAVAVIVLLAIGGGVYMVLSGNDKGSDATKKPSSSPQSHRPIIKNPSEIKTGTPVPSQTPSTSSKPPSNATPNPTPKAAKNN